MFAYYISSIGHMQQDVHVTKMQKCFLSFLRPESKYQICFLQTIVFLRRGLHQFWLAVMDKIL